MTTAQIFADYLGLTPEIAPWAWSVRACGNCHGKGKMWSYFAGWTEEPCVVCNGKKEIKRLTATSPLAPKPTPGWLEVLVGHERFSGLNKGFYAFAQFHSSPTKASSKHCFAHPTHAVARALTAADPDLCARLEACEDWKEVSS